MTDVFDDYKRFFAIRWHKPKYRRWPQPLQVYGWRFAGDTVVSFVIFEHFNIDFEISRVAQQYHEGEDGR